MNRVLLLTTVAAVMFCLYRLFGINETGNRQVEVDKAQFMQNGSAESARGSNSFSSSKSELAHSAADTKLRREPLTGSSEELSRSVERENSKATSESTKSGLAVAPAHDDNRATEEYLDLAMERLQFEIRASRDAGDSLDITRQRVREYRDELKKEVGPETLKRYELKLLAKKVQEFGI